MMLSRILWLGCFVASHGGRTVQRVIGNENEQLLDGDWLERMNITRSDLGSEMTHGECAAFSAEVDVDGVRAYWAAMRQRVKAVARSVPPTERETAPEDGLSWSVYGDHYANTRDLIRLGADVNYVDSFGMTPLQCAASVEYRGTEIIELLLQSGADKKIRTKDGSTALGLAKKYGHTEIQHVLERAGAME
jgi:ankyrin repeat protein